MSDPISEGANTTEIGDQTHGPTGYKSGDIKNAGSMLSTPFTSKAIAERKQTPTDPITKQTRRPASTRINFAGLQNF